MDDSSVPRGSIAAALGAVLNSPEVTSLITELDSVRWTGRKGYGARALVGACLVKSLYALPTWTRTARLIAEHRALADVLGGTPSEWACYRFTVKLRAHSAALATCLDRVTASLRSELPEYGRDIAIDGSDMPAYANGQRTLWKDGPERERYSDPDASWGHRSAVSTRNHGSFYGFKIHAAVCARTGLPLAWEIKTAKSQEFTALETLLDATAARGFAPESCALDKGYDQPPAYAMCADRRILPVIPLRMTSDMLQKPYEAPECEHGLWKFAGADFKRKATKWRCPTGECSPKSKWIKASRRNPLLPRESKRWRNLYRGRGAIEREFGRLKHEYGLAPLRVRGLAKVALHADLTMLARLGLALTRTRAVPAAA